MENKNTKIDNLEIIRLNNETDEIYQECNMPDWDGYNAKAVSESAHKESKEVIKIIADIFDFSYLKKFDVSPTPDGGLVYEWRYGNEKILTISTNGTGEYIVIFIDLFHNDRINGRINKRNIMIILESIKNLMKQNHNI